MWLGDAKLVSGSFQTTHGWKEHEETFPESPSNLWANFSGVSSGVAKLAAP
jgi:hypothetical protein